MKDEEFRNWITELKSRCDIVTVISRYCNVVQRGRNYWCCCPFHIEKTPSLCIYDYEQVYHCYGCKEHGDVITFVRKMESCDYMQAVEILAKSVGMEVPAFSKSNEEEIVKRKKEKDAVLSVLADANKHYQENLLTQDAKLAQEYIKKRKLGRRELEEFGLGYSISPQEMITYLKNKGYSTDTMSKAGLIDKGEWGGFYDHFSQRLTFPIYNIHGDCIGFSARILIDDKTKAKYKNSPTTIVFDKSNTIFGINLVRKYKQTMNFNNVVIVEGQMDVIAMHKAGFKNAVACLGTAFTNQHAKLLKLISNNVIVCLDGDSAGLKAAYKIVDILAENGFDVKCVLIPDGNDPDEYINKFGAPKMKELLDGAINYIDFQIDYLARGIDFSKSDEKSRFVRNALDLLNKLGTGSEKQVYLKHIKELSGVPLDILQQDLFNSGKVIVKDIEISSNIHNIEDGNNKAIKFILASMVYKKDYVKQYDISRFLHNDTYMRLYELMLNKKKAGEELKISLLYDEFDLEEEPNLVDIINYNFDENGNNEKYYEECLWNLYEKEYKQKQAELNNKFKDCADTNERKKILNEISQISKKLKNKVMEE